MAFDETFEARRKARHEAKVQRQKQQRMLKLKLGIAAAVLVAVAVLTVRRCMRLRPNVPADVQCSMCRGLMNCQRWVSPMVTQGCRPML